MNVVYVSPNASISASALIASTASIYGAAEIGAHAIVGHGVIVGFPSPRDQRALVQQGGLPGSDLDESFDMLASQIRTEIGERVHLRSGTVVYAGASVGPDCDCGHNVMIRELTTIGPRTYLTTGTQVMAEVSVGSDCRLAGSLCNRSAVGRYSSMLGHLMHSFSGGLPGAIEASPRIGSGVIVGREAAVVGDVEVANFCIIGAGAVLTKSAGVVGEVWLGNPAKPQRMRDKAAINQLVGLLDGLGTPPAESDGMAVGFPQSAITAYDGGVTGTPM